MGVPGRRGRVGPGAGGRVAWRVPTGREGFGVSSENGTDGVGPGGLDGWKRDKTVLFFSFLFLSIFRRIAKLLFLRGYVTNQYIHLANENLLVFGASS